MYGVDMKKPGAQAYYNSVFELLGSWGVDFVKVDDMSRPYNDHAPEIEAVRHAIDRTRRPMVLSLSPGETPLDAADHARRHANLWRISDDFWDTWPALLEQFARLEKWNAFRGAGYWPDADMLPLGVLDLGKRTTRFTRDEQITLMTLWSIARSPLIMGGDLRKLDDFTLSLLTNDDVLAVNQHSTANRPLFNRDGLVAWIADVPRGSTLQTERVPGSGQSAARVAVAGGDESNAAAAGRSDGSRPVAGQNSVAGSNEQHAIAARKKVAGSATASGDARPVDKYLAVFNTRDRGKGDSANGTAVSIDFKSLGLEGPRLVRDLWQHRNLGEARGTFAPTIPWHGAGLYRLFAPMI
jgi:hypothetical protein